MMEKKRNFTPTLGWRASRECPAWNTWFCSSWLRERCKLHRSPHNINNNNNNKELSSLIQCSCTATAFASTFSCVLEVNKTTRSTRGNHIQSRWVEKRERERKKNTNNKSMYKRDDEERIENYYFYWKYYDFSLFSNIYFTVNGIYFTLSLLLLLAGMAWMSFVIVRCFVSSATFDVCIALLRFAYIIRLVLLTMAMLKKKLQLDIQTQTDREHLFFSLDEISCRSLAR